MVTVRASFLAERTAQLFLEPEGLWLLRLWLLKRHSLLGL